MIPLLHEMIALIFLQLLNLNVVQKWFILMIFNLVTDLTINGEDYISKWVNFDIHWYCVGNCGFGRKESMLNFGFHHLLFWSGKRMGEKEMGIGEAFMKETFLS